jgi:hypothetical protein
MPAAGALLACMLAWPVQTGQTQPAGAPADERAEADLLLVVDCLLPGQVRTLGTRTTYVSARRPARLTARDCQIRGGEYVAYDRADSRSALGAWLPLAEQGDVEARVIVGEIYERGVGVTPDYAAASHWYRLAAEAGSRRAEVNLGHLYERGLGVAVDPRQALQWYRRAAGEDVDLELDAAPQVTEAPAVAAADAAEIEALQARTRELESTLATLRADLDAARVQAADAEAAERAAAERLAAAPAPAPDRSGEIEALQRELAERTREAEAERLRLAQSAKRLQEREAELAAQREESVRLSRELAGASARAAGREEEIQRLQRLAAERLLAGPELSIVEPPLVQTRDIVPVVTGQGSERALVGRVSSPAGIAAVTINGTAVSPNELGVFSSNIPVAAGDSPITVVAVDRQGKRSEVRFLLRKEAPAPASTRTGRPASRGLAGEVDFGSYHALVIGNNDYRHLPDLASPINDVTELARILERRYGFRTTVLQNADRYQVLSALNTLRETLTTRDNLLIYYAGHGELDDVNQRAHWLPVDAERHSTANWIPTTAVTDILNIMRAKQILLVVDSCYAGALTRSAMGRLATGMTDAERLHWYRTMANKRSRTVLTSGGVAPVMDAGGGRHSVFAKALFEVLEVNDETIDGQRLHREVAARVAYAAANLRFDQVPEYAPIRYAGHEAGEFFFVPGT